MNNLFRGLALIGLLTTWAVDARAERGDHDTPATERQSRGIQAPARQCRSDDGWVVCRDAAGHWRRHHYDPWFGGNCRGSDDWPCGPARILPRNVVIDWLHDWRFDNLKDMKLRDDVYTLKAIDRYGRPVRLTIDAFSGRILRQEFR